MCSPMLAVAGITAASGAYSAFNQYREGQAQQNYYNSVADSQQQQGQLALQRGDQQSQAIQDSAKVQNRDFKTQAAEFNASQKAAMAASGLQGVTADDIVSNNLNKQALDEQAIRYNADVKSWEAHTNAANENYDYQEQARQNRISGKNAKKAGKIGAMTTLLGAASSIAGSGAFASKAPAGTMTKSGPISYFPRR